MEHSDMTMTDQQGALNLGQQMELGHRPEQHALAQASLSVCNAAGLWLRTSSKLAGCIRAVAVAAAVLIVAVGSVCAGTLAVPNGSFESPATTFADPRVDAWQKVPKPAWYDESGGYSWDQLAGGFLNTPVGMSNHIDNVEGNQALFLFAVPQVAVFQDYNSTDWSNSVPTHAFNAKFEVGNSYQLTAGVLGGGGNMLEGTSLQLGLYYRDSASNMVTVAATNVVYSRNAFTNSNHLVDYQVTTPVIKSSDPWAGQNIGIQILSTVMPNLVGGYWDLDNVRLSESGGGPALSGATATGGSFGFTLTSEPGLIFQIQTSTNLALQPAGWITLATITNLTGSVTFTDSTINSNAKFYRALQAQ